MPEIHLRQPVITYSACGTFTKNKEKIIKKKKGKKKQENQVYLSKRIR